ncbi:6505_t:CDS:2 [Diversispora eburnea]|uniref:6505_t:CDS:1 n=1 Tax=Diversispora eburnea TaxID=1213867 RepID=A0A9N8ZXF4_9GLOM|nr:6505_t:CDS:2 [Diversispora eburnea]
MTLIDENDKQSVPVTKRIDEINQQRLRFREFAGDSISQSSKLARYAEDVIVFAECCGDNRFSKEDLLELLKFRLDNAKQNKATTEELQLKIKHIIEDLGDINDQLVIYTEDIKKNPRLLDSETKSTLSRKEATKEKLSDTAKANAAIALGGLICSCIAAPFSGGTSLIAPIAAICVDAGIFLTTAGSSLAISTKLLANSENSNIASLDRKLRLERDGLIENIRESNNDIQRIRETCRKFSIFWQEQIDSINNLINKLSSLSNLDDGELRNIRMISVGISKSWKNVSKECKTYNQIMWSLLDNDGILKIQ